MNERTTQNNWKEFAESNGYRFEASSESIIHGIITEFKILEGDELIVHSKFAKTNSAFNHQWIIVKSKNVGEAWGSGTFKAGIFNSIFPKSDPKKALNSLLRSNGAKELRVDQDRISIKFRNIPETQNELKQIINLMEKVKTAGNKT